MTTFNEKGEQLFIVDYLNPATGYLFGMQQVYARTAQAAVDEVRRKFCEEGISVKVKSCKAVIDMEGKWA